MIHAFVVHGRVLRRRRACHEIQNPANYSILLIFVHCQIIKQDQELVCLEARSMEETLAPDVCKCLLCLNGKSKGGRGTLARNVTVTSIDLLQCSSTVICDTRKGFDLEERLPLHTIMAALFHGPDHAFLHSCLTLARSYAAPYWLPDLVQVGCEQDIGACDSTCA